MKNKEKVSDEPKKKFYQRKWFWIVVIVLLLCLLFGGGDESDNEKITDTNNITTEEQEQKDLQEETTATEENVEITDEDILVLLNAYFKDGGTWKAADNKQFIFYPENDLADAFNFIIDYYQSYGEIPEEIKESYNKTYNSFIDLSKTISDETGESCVLAIANPSNTDNVILVFENGIVTYDAFNE